MASLLPFIKRKGKDRAPDPLSGKKQKYSYYCKLPREGEDMKAIFKRMYVEDEEKPDNDDKKDP